MKQLQEVGEQQKIAWAKSKGIFKPEYELRSGNDVLATLRWREVFGPLAEGQAADGHWTFNCGGFFRQRVTVRLAGQDADLAVFRWPWRGSGLVEFQDGRKFRFFRTPDFWCRTYAFEDIHGQQFLQFDLNWFGTSVKLETKPMAKSLPELTLLSILGLYILILMKQKEILLPVKT